MLTPLAAAVAVLAVLTACISLLIYRLLRQNRRVLMRLEALEAREADPPGRRQGRGVADRSLSSSRSHRERLILGSAAPAFRLPTLDGRTVSLADYAGRRVLLVFFDPGRGTCADLLPRLDEAARATDVPVLLVSHGGVDANRRTFVNARPALTIALQADREISRLYATSSTPSAYLVDEHGRIASDVAAGATAILSLLSVSSPDAALAAFAGHVPVSRLTH